MILATAYNVETGEILRAITASSREDLMLNVLEHESLIGGSFDPAYFYIKNEHPTLLPEKPDWPCHFDYALEQWVWDESASWSKFKAERNRRLAASDWTQVPDAPVDQAAWATYRQQLRDLPSNTTDPRNPTWPTPPA